MLNEKERYFIWNIIHPYNELLNILNNNGQIEYYDNEYSPLIDKVSNLCIKTLNIFEQIEFCGMHGKIKRNELNKNDMIFHRILSYGIKAKHGNISNQHYSNFDLKLPITVFYNENTNKYYYKYTPLLNNEDFIKDFEYVINELINLYLLKITFKNDYKDTEYTILDDNTIYISPLDIYNYHKNGMTNSVQIRTLKLVNNMWEASDLDKFIDFKLHSVNN